MLYPSTDYLLVTDSSLFIVSGDFSDTYSVSNLQGLRATVSKGDDTFRSKSSAREGLSCFLRVTLASFTILSVFLLIKSCHSDRL